MFTKICLNEINCLKLRIYGKEAFHGKTIYKILITL